MKIKTILLAIVLTSPMAVQAGCKSGPIHGVWQVYSTSAARGSIAECVYSNVKKAGEFVTSQDCTEYTKDGDVISGVPVIISAPYLHKDCSITAKGEPESPQELSLFHGHMHKSHNSFDVIAKYPYTGLWHHHFIKK